MTFPSGTVNFEEELYYYRFVLCVYMGIHACFVIAKIYMAYIIFYQGGILLSSTSDE